MIYLRTLSTLLGHFVAQTRQNSSTYGAMCNDKSLTGTRSSGKLPNRASASPGAGGVVMGETSRVP